MNESSVPRTAHLSLKKGKRERYTFYCFPHIFSLCNKNFCLVKKSERVLADWVIQRHRQDNMSDTGEDQTIYQRTLSACTDTFRDIICASPLHHENRQKLKGYELGNFFWLHC